MAVHCPYCNYPNFADATTCRRCKKELPRVCKECGKTLPPGAGFCTKCGAIYEKHIDVSVYKTKSLRSRSYDDDRAEIEADERDRSDRFKPKIHRLKKCPECWHNISEDAKFCTYCGTVFDEVDEKESPPTPSVSVRQPRQKPDKETKPKAEPEKKAAPVKTAKPAAVKSTPPPPKPTIKPPAPKKAPPVPKPMPLPTAKPPEPAAAAGELDFGLINVPTNNYPRPQCNGEVIAIHGFRLSRTPVTCEQYRVFCQDTGHPTPVDWIDGKPLPGKDNHPVVMVSLLDALAFCRWAGLRLPTSDEWTVAFCGKQPKTYPWGDDPEAVSVNCIEQQRPSTTPVQVVTDDAGPFGHHDLVGNVRQFTFDPAPNAPPPEPDNLPDGNVGLAGAGYFDPIWLAKFGRVDIISDPAFMHYTIGFRCAADL